MKNATNNIQDDIKKLVQTEKIDFFDFGCSNGDSLLFGTNILGGHKGLGIDINNDKILSTREKNLLAINYDIKKLPNKKLVDFTIMSHFLEHVPNIKDVECFIAKACLVSKDFVFIRQPFFDADGLLLAEKLKTYYSDWKGHPNTMSSLQFYTILRTLKNKGIIKHFIIGARDKISNSNHPRIHPLTSEIDQHNYDPKIHPKKNSNIKLEFELYFEIIVIISIDATYDISSKYKIDKVLYSSD